MKTRHERKNWMRKNEKRGKERETDKQTEG